MVNRPKQQGTAAETATVAAAVNRGLEAQRYENGAEGRDVDIRADRLRIVEVKSRANLNVHKTLAATQARWPGIPASVSWTRLSRKGDNVRRTADGPKLACLPECDLFDLFAVAKAARTAAFDASVDAIDARWALGEALRLVDAAYPAPP